MDRTTIGAVSRSTRSAVKAYRDRNELENYDDALQTLLEEAGAADTLTTEG